MAGYSGTPLIKKLGLKDNATFTVLNSPVSYGSLLGNLPPNAKEIKNLRPETNFIHFFCKSKSELEKLFPKLKKALVQDGTLWISWPKKSSGVRTDLTEG